MAFVSWIIPLGTAFVTWTSPWLGDVAISAENSEKSLSVREREIEKLKAISKKWEMMYNYLKKKESQTGK